MVLRFEVIPSVFCCIFSTAVAFVSLCFVLFYPRALLIQSHPLLNLFSIISVILFLPLLNLLNIIPVPFRLCKPSDISINSVIFYR